MRNFKNFKDLQEKLEKRTYHVRIMAEWGYYLGTFNCPKDGYLRCYDGHYDEILEFSTIEEAQNYIKDFEPSVELNTINLSFETSGEYYLSHGQYSPTIFKIRCFKNIKN